MKVIIHQNEAVYFYAIGMNDKMKIIFHNAPDFVEWNTKPLAVNASGGDVIRELT